MDGIKELDASNVDIKTNKSEIDTTYSITSSKSDDDSGMNQIENTESYQNIPNTYSVNDVEVIDLSIFVDE